MGLLAVKVLRGIWMGLVISAFVVTYMASWLPFI